MRHWIMDRFGHVCQDQLTDGAGSATTALFCIAKFEMHPPWLSSYVSHHPKMGIITVVIGFTSI